jgi:predicted adenylyl cyclase CyaB
VRASHYRRVEVTAAQPLCELLSAALGVVGVVEKTRRLFLYDHVRIHLDDVDGLGSFVELEAVLPEGSDVPAGDEVLDRVISALRLGERPSIGGGYLELLNAS